MNIKKFSWYIFPLAGFLLVALFSLTQASRFLDLKLYDLLLHARPTPAEEERILLVEIDDPTIAEVRTYPLGREVVAQGARHFWENSTSFVVFDSEYIDPSPRGVNEQYLRRDIPRQLSDNLGAVAEYGSGLADAVAAGQIPPDAVQDYLMDYQDFTYAMEDELLASIEQVILDKDIYMGRHIGLMGNAIITIGTQDDPVQGVSQELKDSARFFSLQNVSVIKDSPLIAEAMDIRPSIAPISSQALTLGFPRVHIDDDGVRRQIDLIYRYQDQYYPQLGFAVITEWLNPQGYEISPNAITLTDLTMPDGTAREKLRIPLNREGRMYINWPHEKFLESFRHLSYLKFIKHDQYMDSIIYNLNQLQNWGFMGMYSGENPLDYFNYTEEYLEMALDNPQGFSGEEYRQIRDAGLEALQVLLDSSLEADGMAELQNLMELPDFPPEEREAIEILMTSLPENMASMRELTEALIPLRASLYEDLQGSVIVLGYTGESTQDIGVTPFEKQYMNMGLHGAVLNTVLQEDFLDDRPLWISILVALVLSAVLVFILRRGSSWRSMALAIVLWLAGLGSLVLIFRFTGIYLGVMTPLLSTVVTSIILLVVKFILENQEKGYIKNAFGQYLSKEVINSLLQNPDQLSLGGQEKELTAIFTDVKGFSTISEQLTPTQLVNLLNRYLTAMSDIILDHRGTIDKFEGDAIIAFYGAPHSLENHAQAAVLSALQMKKVEAILNDEFLNSKPAMTPSPLLTRFGVNTGRMVVGNMGTTRKMDYTIMGNAVNLAARLEGVNKEYATWVLTSHFTYEHVKNDVVVRPLDRVRVVGINEPVQLYNVVEEKAFATRELMEQLELFERAMEMFRGRKWEDASKAFEEYTKLFPDDGAGPIYTDRSRAFAKKPPAANWDGVYNLTRK